jgi:hypothetical protein
VKAKNKSRVVICHHFPRVNQGFYFPFPDYRMQVWRNIIAFYGVVSGLRGLIHGYAHSVLQPEITSLVRKNRVKET